VQFEVPLLNLYVKPDQPVVSYLTPLTGLTAELLERHGTSLSIALATLRQALPKEAVLVGQSIRTDTQWLGLQEGVDFAGMIDLAGLFRVFNPQYKSWSVFGQDHLARVLLGIDNSGCAP
jgi:RNA exonuclease 4